MRLHPLLLIAGLLALLFGLGFLLVPGPLLAGYGVTADPAAILMARFFGAAALMGQISGLVGALGWLAVLIYFLLLLGFGSCLIAKPRVL